MYRRHLSPVAGLAAIFCALACLAGMKAALSAKVSAQQACFSNLSKVARATLMYVADNDGVFPPHRTSMEPYTCQWGADNADPWLRWPVLLDPYVSDRSAYVCEGVEVPKLGHGAATRPSWIAGEPITTKVWPNGPCGSVWPSGWGGAVTDSSVQGACLDPGRFVATVGAAVGELGGSRLSDIGDPEHHVMWADSSRMSLKLGTVVYANACRADCADLKDKADWDNCPWSQKCGAGGDFATNPEVSQGFTRHHGGSNIAFVDGHVEWRSINQIIAGYRAGYVKGIAPATATEGRPWYLK